MIDWELCKKNFEPDGSLRDIYVLGTSLDDWRKVVDFICCGPYRASFTVGGRRSESIGDLSAAFRSPGRPMLGFQVGDVDINCHFFSEEEVEFDFVPNGLTQKRLDGILDFILALGRLTKKPVHLTPENGRDLPIFRYAPERDDVTYVSFG